MTTATNDSLSRALIHVAERGGSEARNETKHLALVTQPVFAPKVGENIVAICGDVVTIRDSKWRYTDQPLCQNCLLAHFGALYGDRHD